MTQLGRPTTTIGEFLDRTNIQFSDPGAGQRFCGWLDGIQGIGLLEPLVEIVAVCEEVWRMPRHQHFTRHGILHSSNMTEKITSWLHANQFELTPCEAFVLFGGIYLHDVGMQCTHRQLQHDQDIDPTAKQLTAPDYDYLEEIRQQHRQLSAAMIRDACLLPEQRSYPQFFLSCSAYPHEAEAMALLAMHHGGPLSEVAEEIRTNLSYTGTAHPIRLLLLIELIRIGDALDADYRRVNTEFIAKQSFTDLPAKERFHLLKHHYVANIHCVGSGEFHLTYRLPADDEELYADVRRCVECHLRQHQQECGSYLNEEHIAFRDITHNPQPLIGVETYPLADDVRAMFRTEGRDNDMPPPPRGKAEVTVAGPLPPVWMIPFWRNPYFTGRDEELIRLTEHFTTNHAPYVLHGLGGIGKSQLAAEYAWQHAGEYDTVLWVNAESDEALFSNLAALTSPVALRLPEASERDVNLQYAAVLKWLHTHQRWLLIADNADTPEVVAAINRRLPATLPGHLLITSRRDDWPMRFTHRQLSLFTKEDAADFLLRRTADGEGHPLGTLAEAEAVAEELGCLALALEQAAAYIKRRRISLTDYLRRLHDTPVKVLQDVVSGGTEYPRSVMQTWQITEEKLSPAARILLRLLAFLAPADIPRTLVTHLTDDLQAALAVGDPTSVEMDADQLEAALVELAEYSLITLTPDSVHCHRLLQLVLRYTLTAEERDEWTGITLRLVNTHVGFDSDDVSAWPQWEAIRPHLEHIIAAADAAGIADPTTRLMNNFAQYLDYRAHFHAAEPLMRRALAIDEQAFGPDHHKVAIRLNNLAQLLKATNRLTEAEPLMRRALAIDEQTFEPDHPEVATDLGNLANLLQDTNRLVEAEPLMRRALAIGEQALGQDHPKVAIHLNNLALLLKATNRLTEAEPLMRQALAIDEQAFGPDHPKVAIRLNNLAQLLKATNRLTEAEPLMRRALTIDEQAFGPDHPKVAIGLNNLAQLLQATNRLTEAEPLMRRALAIDEQAFGPDHPEVATDLSNLAILLHATNRLSEAEPLMRRALTIDEQAFGPDHPNVANRLNNLAILLHATNRRVWAKPLLRRALNILEQFTRETGHEHPELAQVRNNYQQCR
ncbi:MAG: FxSxx-COOH system tetratricopeptide repeat protein [Armatimonadota bacterium]